MKKQINLIAVLMFLFAYACNNNTQNNQDNSSSEQQQSENIETPKKDCNDVHWSHHKGEDGPENWKNLCTGFSDCGGKSQSPIDIQTQSVINIDTTGVINFEYATTKVDIINNSHTVQFNVDEGNKIMVDNKDYQLLQFHYHALSEHTVDGKHYPIEVHFVHKHSDNELLVVGVFFVEGKENKLFKEYLNNFPTSKGEFKSENTINLSDLFPENKSTYHYQGSLTTPPCSEIVSWYVMKNTVEASKEQIEAFSKILNNNYRPTLPVNDRKIELYNN